MARPVPRRVAIVAAVGVAAVFVGLYLQWLLRVDPISPNLLYRRALGEETGLRGPDYWHLGLVVAGIVGGFVASKSVSRRAGGLAVSATGFVSAVVCVRRLTLESTAGIDVLNSDLYVAGPGAFVTMGGSALVVVAGAFLLNPPKRRRSNAGLERESDADSPETDSVAPTVRTCLREIPAHVHTLALFALAAIVVSGLLEWRLLLPRAVGGTGVSETAPRPPGGTHLGVLGVAVLVVSTGLGIAASYAATVRYRDPGLGGSGLFATGSVPSVLALFHYGGASGWHQPAPASFVAGPGTYLALAAGASLVVAGALLDRSGEPLRRSPAPEPARFARLPKRVGAFPWGAVTVAIAGVYLVVGGTALPWLSEVPNVLPRSPAFGPRMEVGVAGSHAFLIGVAVVGVLASLGVTALSSGRRRGGAFLFGTGVLTTSITCYRVIDSTSLGRSLNPLSGYVPGPGLYVSLLGCSLLVFSGALLWDADDERSTAASREREPTPGDASGSRSEPAEF